MDWRAVKVAEMAGSCAVSTDRMHRRAIWWIGGREGGGEGENECRQYRQNAQEGDLVDWRT